MSWRVILVSKPCKIQVKSFQLDYQPLEGEAVSVPLEDIAAVILETHQATVSSHLLAEMAERGIVLFSCGESHLPSGLFMPFHQHSRFAEVSAIQQDCSLPFKKRVWQRLVQAKIRNQAHALKLCSGKNHALLEAFADKVQSGDSSNAEAQAARVYWENLFENFSRQTQNTKNSALNYGYAIVRGAVARAVCGAGLLPCFGVGHANKLNAFNLVDDLMEPFRPFVDVKVFSLFGKTAAQQENAELSLSHRQALVQVLARNCLLSGENMSILKACDDSAFSLVNAMREKTPEKLLSPVFAET